MYLYVEIKILLKKNYKKGRGAVSNKSRLVNNYINTLLTSLLL